MVKISFNLFILILFFSLNGLVLLDPEQIIFSFQMFRHGARGPYLGVENGKDKYKESWTMPEQLTDMGRRMLYLLGVKFRKRYNNFLSKQYSPQEIYIRSTDTNRTIESVYSFLQGLYPEGPEIKEKVRNAKDIIYPPNIKYKEDFDYILNKYGISNTGVALPHNINIAPIHLINRADREFDLQNQDLCPARAKILNESYQSDLITNLANDILEKTGNLFKELEPSDDSSFLKYYWNLLKYMDGFYCDDFDMRDFSFIKNKYDENTINLLRNYSIKFSEINYFDINFPKNDENVSLATMSQTMGYILGWMNDAKNKTESQIKSYLKYVIYSAHDLNIANLDHFMNIIFNTSIEQCDFACTRIFELYKLNNEYYVRYFKDETNIKLNITYNEFISNINKNIWDKNQTEEYCKVVVEDNNDDKDEIEYYEDKKSAAYYSMIVLIIVDMLLIMFIIAFYKTKKK